MVWSADTTQVNSWNEWDPLRHVIVGVATDGRIPPPEPALDAKVPQDSDMRGKWGKRPRETADRANELLDTFADMLRARGIRVDRPSPTDFALPVSTPDFHTSSQFGCMPPRAVLLTVGSEILEAAMSYRCRWFEYLSYRSLLRQYWAEDPNFRHEAAPKPRLTDADYHNDYLSEKSVSISACNGPPRNSSSPPKKNRCSTPPTYCASGANWWSSTASPPTLRASTGSAATSPTTGCTL